MDSSSRLRSEGEDLPISSPKRANNDGDDLPVISPKRAKTADSSSAAKIPVEKPAATKTQSISNNSDPTCMICGKTFTSPKGMHGHLRTHPNRPTRRGANSRRKITAHASSTTVLASPSPPLPKYPIDGGHVHQDYSPDVLSCAYDFLQVSNDYDHPSYAITSSSSSSSSSSDRQVPTNMDLQEIASTYQAIKIQEESEVKKTYQAVGIQEESEAKKTFQCTICSKTFTSHQGLGGHTASHNKNNREATETAAGKVSEHCCKVCKEVYPTGQALGGHMRKHYQGPLPINSKATLPVAPSEGTGSSDETRVIFAFDLNEEPIELDGDELVKDCL